MLEEVQGIKKTLREMRSSGARNVSFVNPDPTSADDLISIVRHERLHDVVPPYISQKLSVLSRSFAKEAKLPNSTSWYSDKKYILEEALAYRSEKYPLKEALDQYRHIPILSELFQTPEFNKLFLEVNRSYNRFSLGNRFSGFDDAYNTIEGLLHGGMAGTLRKKYKFGSGYQGQKDNDITVGGVLSGINTAFLIGAAGLTGYDRFGWKGALGGAAAAVGIWAGTEALKYEQPQSFFQTVWNGSIEGIKTSASASMLASSFMRGSFLNRKFLDPRLMKKFNPKNIPEIGVEDILEVQAEILKSKGLNVDVKAYVAGGSMGAALRDMRQRIEGKVPGRLGKALGMAFESQTGSPAMLDLVIKHGNIQSVPMRDFFLGNIKDIGMGAGAGALLSLPFSALSYSFSGRDDAYNTIEGLRHGGMAEKERKKNTPFGSGYDVVRGIAQDLGQSYGSVLKDKAFAAAIRGGAVVKELGSGQFGVTHLMKTSYMGREFSYIRKSIHEGEEHLARWAQTNREGRLPLDFIKHNTNLKNEASAMSMLADTSFAPSPYLAESNQLFMELMPGKALHDLGVSNVPKDILPRVRQAIEETKSRGLANFDIKADNIMYDAASNRVSWIDWGVATSKTKNLESWGMNIDHELRMEIGFEKLQNTLKELSSFANSSAPIVSRSQHLSGPLTGAASPDAIRKRAAMNSSVEDKTSLYDMDMAAGLSIARPSSNMGLNPFNGFSHGGMASLERRLYGDFGSPWKGWFGGISRRISRFMAKNPAPLASKLTNPIEAARLAKGKNLEQFIEALGEKNVIVANTPAKKAFFEDALRQQPGLGGGAGMVVHDSGEKYILMDPARLQKSFQEFGTKAGIKDLSSVGTDDFLNTVLFHEVLERQVSNRFATLARTTVGQHNAAQVLIGEGGFVKSLGNSGVEKVFAGVRGAIKGEIQPFSAGLEAWSPNANKKLQTLITDFAPVPRPGPPPIPPQALKPGTQVLAAQRLQQAQAQLSQAAIGGGKNHTSYTSGRSLK